MPDTNAVDDVNAFPPIEFAYHFIPDPVANKSAIVPELQTVCVPEPEGAAGLFITTVTFNLLILSQDNPDDIVCVA